MNTIQRITKNIGVLFLSQMLSYILGFFTLMYTARYLGVEGYGSLSFALAFTGIFSVFVDLGLNTLTIRELARNNKISNEFIDNILPLRILLATIIFILIVILINLMGYSKEVIEVVYLITVSMLFNVFTQLFYSVFQAYEKMEYKSLGLILNSALLLSGVLLAIFNKFNLIYFSSIYPIVAVIIFIYSFAVCYFKFLKPKLKFDLHFSRDLLKESWPFGITGISITLYIWIDTIILSIMKGQEAVGLYNASYNLIMVFLFIPLVFNSAIFPLMSKYYISSKKSLIVSFEKLFKIMIIIAIPLGIGTILLANKAIILIYGEQFTGSIIALQILIWSTVLNFVRSPIERLLESSNRQLLITKAFIIGIIFNITVNLLIIPIYSYVGAAIVTVLTDCLLLIILIRMTKGLKIQIPNKIKINILKIVISSLIMVFILNQLLYLNIFILILVGSFIYFSVLILLKIFDNDEILMIKAIFNKN